MGRGVARGRLEPRLKRSVVALLTSVFCSSTAMAALTIALGKQVYDLTGRELDLGLLGLAEFTPALLLVFVTGPVADRFDRRTIGRIALGVEAAFCVALARLCGERSDVGRSDLRLGDRLRHRARVRDARDPLAARRHRAARAAPVAGGTPVGHVAGRGDRRARSLAGFLYAADVQLPFVMVVGTARRERRRVSPSSTRTRATRRCGPAPSCRPVRTTPLRVAPTVHRSKRVSLHDALEGIRFVRGNQILLGVISLDLFAVLFGGAVALLPAIAEERLGVGAVGLGWLRAAVGIGAAAVTLVLTVRPVTRHVGSRMLVAVGVFGVGHVVLGLTTNYVIAWIALAVLSGADAVSVFIRGTLVPLVTPADKRGRVLAVEMVFIGASNELGAFESGVVGQFLGPAAAVVLGGIATIAIAFLWASRFPALRATDHFPTSIN